MRLYDAHNHLQDERLGGTPADLLTACAQAGVVKMMVNGSCEQDWPQVLALARNWPQVRASIGCHPWYIHQRSPDWESNLRRALDGGGVAVGEIGLDRWKPDLSYDGQEEVFVAQWRLAVERDLPASLHCLRAWGRLHDLLRAGPRPRRGFLLHSYGGPREMVEPLARLGAYFSFPGYYAHERKVRQRETFRAVPADRLLLETDAPDQLPPESCIRHPWQDVRTGRAINHPANLPALYEFVSGFLGEPLEKLAARVEENFLRLFGPD